MEDERDAERLERRAGEVGRDAASPTAAGAAPRTCEKPTPPRSRSVPPSTSREMPSPSSAAAGLALPGIDDEGVAAFLLERGDDARLQAEQVVAPAASTAGVSMGRSAAERALADVGAPLRARERDPANRVVRALLRQPRRVAERGDAEDAAARGHDAAVAQRRAGVKDLDGVIVRIAVAICVVAAPPMTSPLRGAAG